MTPGWGVITRACGLKERHALHFKYDGALLFFKVFGENSECLEWCPRGGKALDGELGPGHAPDASSSSKTFSRESSSDDDYDESPRHRHHVWVK